MSTKYKATIPGKAYFITITTVNWVDLFTRLDQKMVLVNALNYCAEHKGLEVHGYCIMPSHIHILCRAKDDDLLANVVRDFKKYTAKKSIETILNGRESRREWLLEMFEKSCAHLKRNQTFKVWQNGYHAVRIESEKFVRQKLNYIHNNPVVDKIVEHPWEYIFSSARNYADMEGLVKVHCLRLARISNQRQP
ncbi:MAG: transposase [Bacteroidetes bacterium RIFCSPHIGHO2_02_FULL_44_7]|nr:MAG: transposase [Bacteroidetes bacterium RIFCSPHIGHO2_02_FULL_44_7]